MDDDRAALRRLLVDSGALSQDQLDAQLAGWTSGAASAFLISRGAVDRTAARMLDAALKGYARLTPTALRGLFKPPDDLFKPSPSPAPTTAPPVAPSRPPAVIVAPPAPRAAANDRERPPSPRAPAHPPPAAAAPPVPRSEPPRVITARSVLPTVGEIFGRYRLLGEVGSSDRTRVLRARDESSATEVIIKMCQPAAASEMNEWFAANVRSTMRIKHAGVQQVLDAGTLDGIPFIVFASLHAQNLQHYLKRTGPLALVGASRIGEQLAHVLAAAARAQVVHGDLIPSNVLIATADEAVHISDFGMRPAGDSPFVAPELRSGAAADPRSDMYALGTIIHMLALGEPPRGDGASLGRAAPLLAALVARLTAKLPDDRFDDWEDVLGAFTLAMPRSQRVATLNPR